MRASEFVKQFGWDKAKECLENCASPNDKWFVYEGVLICDDEFDDLKRLVESWELVELWGCLEDAKLYSFDHCKDKPESAGYKLMMAIKDVESCQ